MLMLQEIVLVPTDESLAQIASVRRGGGTIEIPDLAFEMKVRGDVVQVSFETEPGVDYVSERRDDLIKGDWELLDLIPGNGQRQVFEGTEFHQSAGFYRITKRIGE